MTASTKVAISARAEADLEAIFEWIAISSGEARARSVVDGIVRQCRGLELFPRRGAPRDDLFPGLRVIAHRDRASIAFTITGPVVTIQSVLWRGRDLNAAFDLKG